MNPEASNASKQNSIVIPAKHSHSQAMNVVVLGSTHKNTTPHRTKPNEEEEAEKLVVEVAKEEKVRRADCGQGSLMLLPKANHKNHEQQHAHSLNVNEPVSRADCRQGSLLVTSTRERKNHEERHTHGSSKYIYSG